MMSVIAHRLFASLIVLSLWTGLCATALAEEPMLRIGLVGLDSSHAPAFAKAINDPQTHPGLEGAKIVAAFPGGSADLPVSADRLAGFTKTLADQGIAIVGSIDELVSQVDAVIITSVDGRVHLPQATAVIAAGKKLFIDKPMTNSVAEADEIFTLAAQHKVPCFSSSSLRFAPEILQLKEKSGGVGAITGCVTYSPCATQLHHPDLFWYGIHGVETLFTLMGPGCESVACIRTEGADEVVGVWKDGRVGTFRGIRSGKSGFGAMAFGTAGIASATVKVSYEPMLVEIVKFFRTGAPPVATGETLEVLAFMEAANESHKQGGIPVFVKSAQTAAK
ncbi:Gfo/Idh/MocA family protein [Planctomicrobium piriforme]|uniref:Predicted dehydrogenase n=1 Tax=Planctomicrobium piriforme TaxID=1576369 RepID=A0A1I3H177_9PLAN|nr:Gfo/Idh/MocA family oxidoreductase [Planctomicrobium piriforme]SFI29376.1 Predicted dehydrogenase [Planctomicrobium piriforme]